MAQIDITKEQKDFLVGVIDRTSQGIWDDPECYGFDRDDYDNEKKYEQDIQKYIDDVCNDLINKLNKLF